jgi:hypothetical protein
VQLELYWALYDNSRSINTLGNKVV